MKICRIADKSADLFAKTVTVRDWDIAAPELILKEAGGVLLTSDGDEFIYNHSYEKKGVIAASSEQLSVPRAHSSSSAHATPSPL